MWARSSKQVLCSADQFTSLASTLGTALAVFRSSSSSKHAINHTNVPPVVCCDVAARTVMEEWDESGPIRPRHLREAYRRMQLKGKIPSAATYTQKKIFRK